MKKGCSKLAYCPLISLYHIRLPIKASVVPPGQPKVDKAGPLLPALDTNITLCLYTASVKISQTRLKL